MLPLRFAFFLRTGLQMEPGGRLFHISERRYPVDFQTLEEALSKTQPGDKLLLELGYYNVTQEVASDRLIVGDGDRKWVKVDSIICRTAHCTLRNLTISHGIQVLEGEAVLEDCDLYNATESPVVTVAAGASVVIRRCFLHETKDACLDVTGPGARAVVHECHLHSKGGNGITISGGGTATITNCRIGQCSTGILVTQGSKATVETCIIEGVKMYGVQCSKGSDLGLAASEIRKCRLASVCVSSGSEAWISNNIIDGEMDIKPDCNVTCEKNSPPDELQSAAQVEA